MSKFDYTDSADFYAEMVELGKQGLTLKECGQYHGIDSEVWEQWCRDHPLTEIKLQRGKAQGLALAGRQLLSQIEAGKLNAITFYLKTQGNFTEKQAIQLENITPMPPPMPPVPADPVEAAKTYQHYMQGS